MTDKTPNNQAENPVNTPEALAKTTDKARDGEPKSRALPQANELKARFKAGSIPLQTDFADLIDLANVGRQAVGGAEGQTGPANGFTLSPMGHLELKPNPDKGISVAQDGVAIKLKTISGLTMDENGISVKLKVDKGIELKDSGGISIKPGNGISVDEGGIAVKAEKNKGLQVNINGVSVNVGKGMRVSSTGMIEPDVTSYAFGNVENQVEYTPVKVNTSTNGLVVDLYKGLINTSSGLSVNVGNGLQVDKNKKLSLTPEQTFQKGMIMMFSGVSVPSGWALCDGMNGTPNLIDRFVLGGEVKNIGIHNNKVLSGSGNNKEYASITTRETVPVTGNTTATTLSIKQIPNHRHQIGVYMENDGNPTQFSGSYTVNTKGDIVETHKNYSTRRVGYTESVGSTQGHSHQINITSNQHSHSVNSIPPYYILAFIMKL